MTNTTSPVYISKIKKNVILPENKTVEKFIQDYEMWNGCPEGLKMEGYLFPENEKVEKNTILHQEKQNELRKKRQLRKKQKKEQYKIDQYNREKHPFYGKKMSDRVQLQKEAQQQMDNQKLMKDEQMKKIMEHMSTMTEEEQKEYMNQMLSQNQINPEN